ncbi:hypothetical protein MKW98_025248 [Papaver atlanticum]|uniref:Uncharacterized protein n=1 Tax=Papaver atlanticum TaxID=357466 RepID=A0AAD4X6L0_9MAGN|nr:hypothetical protein MKW98_025248 [Papaver atlanticum]
MDANSVTPRATGDQIKKASALVRHVDQFANPEEDGENSSKRSDQEPALTKPVDALEMSSETAPASHW